MILEKCANCGGAADPWYKDLVTCLNPECDFHFWYFKPAIWNMIHSSIRIVQDLNETWSPTPAKINALPEQIRKYICDLETNADPAGDVAALRLTMDQNAFLQTRAGRTGQPNRV